MKKLLLLLTVAYLFVACNTTSENNQTEEMVTDTIKVEEPPAPPPLKPYNELKFIKEEKLTAAPGTKSVVFNPTGDKLYALNLEGMSVSEFDQKTKALIREFKFKATPGLGWNYETARPMKSYEEKPVEAAFSHNGAILWVSLHNAGGLVPIHINTAEMSKTKKEDSDKELYVKYPDKEEVDTVYVPIIKTGKTPKVIATTEDSRFLLVSNWHSHSVSVLDISLGQYPYGTVLKDIPVGAIPRGIVIDEKNKKSYIAIMGGSRINVIDNDTWELIQPIQLPSNPRHIVEDNNGKLYVSYNSWGQVACIDSESGKTLFKAGTKSNPRSIQLSKNNQFLFVTCYKGNSTEVFKIHEDRFELIYSLPSSGSPVGVDVFEDDHHLEAWVCNYTMGNIKIFEFDKE